MSFLLVLLSLLLFTYSSSLGQIIRPPTDAFERLEWNMSMMEVRRSLPRGAMVTESATTRTDGKYLTLSVSDSAFGLPLRTSYYFREGDSSLSGIALLALTTVIPTKGSIGYATLLWDKVEVRYGKAAEIEKQGGAQMKEWQRPPTQVRALKTAGRTTIVVVTFAPSDPTLSRQR
jgi:hypothetical protein